MHEGQKILIENKTHWIEGTVKAVGETSILVEIFGHHTQADLLLLQSSDYLKEWCFIEDIDEGKIDIMPKGADDPNGQTNH
jgi:hypothetical protein